MTAHEHARIWLKLNLGYIKMANRLPPGEVQDEYRRFADWCAVVSGAYAAASNEEFLASAMLGKKP